MSGFYNNLNNDTCKRSQQVADGQSFDYFLQQSRVKRSNSTCEEANNNFGVYCSYTGPRNGAIAHKDGVIKNRNLLLTKCPSGKQNMEAEQLQGAPSSNAVRSTKYTIDDPVNENSVQSQYTRDKSTCNTLSETDFSSIRRPRATILHGQQGYKGLNALIDTHVPSREVARDRYSALYKKTPASSSLRSYGHYAKGHFSTKYI